MIIPQSNASHLMLNAEVRQAIADEKFHIYTINHIDEALSLMTGVTIKKANKKIMREIERMNPKEESA